MELVTVEVLRGLDKLSSSNDSNTLREANEVASRCRCLPACTSIEYEAETSQADYDWKAVFMVHKVPIEEDQQE